jgi:hypothetical protein
MLWLNNYATSDDEKKVPALQPWAAALVYMTYVLAIFTFYFSLACAGLATIIGALGFLNVTQLASFVGFITVMVCAGLTLLASATSGIVYTKDKGTVKVSSDTKG